MKILVNFAPLKTGGGQNVGLNFLNFLLKMEENFDSYYFIVAKGSAIHKVLKQNHLNNYTAFPNNPIIRIMYELLFGRYIIKKNEINIIYSNFGVGLYPRNIPQITCSADSNLYFPEIDFWQGYKGVSLLKKKLVDNYRKWCLKRADGIIFENKILEERFHKLYNFTGNTILIKPSINHDFVNKPINLPNYIPQNIIKGLFLCGWHLNKNVMIMPKIAAKLKEKKINFHFLFTAAEDNSTLHKNFLKLVNYYFVQDMISIIGKVKKEELRDLYNKIDFVFLLSNLESFSNNIIEAWSFERVLIISDLEWARAICGEAAIYVDRNDPNDIAQKLQEVINNERLKNKIILEGNKNLKTYPSIKQKTEAEINFLRYIYEKY